MYKDHYQAEANLRRAIRRYERQLELLQSGNLQHRRETGVSLKQEIANIKSYIAITREDLQTLKEPAE